MISRGEQVILVLRGLVKLVALVGAAGAVGVVVGTGLSKLSTTGSAAPPRATTTPDEPQRPLAQVRVSLLDAQLHTEATPSGRQEQQARMTVRLRVDNGAQQPVSIKPPTLRVGSVRVEADPDPERMAASFEPLRAGSSQTVTLRFSLAGEATPKVVRDRRARMIIAGRELPVRVKVRSGT